MYEVKRITLDKTDLREVLLPKLRERVFHVTTQEAWPCIQKSGRVLVSAPDCVIRWENAGLRCIGHVSLCDLRSLEEEDLQHGLQKYYFLDPRRHSRGPVFLFLGRCAIEETASYQQLKGKVNRLGKLIAPFIEAGYPGDLSLAKIADVLRVDIIRNPTPHHPANLASH